MALLAVGYFVAGKLGLKLAFDNASVTTVWPPTGIAIASLLLGGLRFAPAVLVGAYATNCLVTGPGLVSIGIAIGNTAEAVAAAWLVSRFASHRLAFQRALDTIRFCVLACFVSTTISPTIGCSALLLGGRLDWGELAATWSTWWLGDVAGALMVAPPILLAFDEVRSRWTRAHTLEAAFLLVLIVATSLLVFGGLSPVPDPRYPMQFLCMPLLIWVAYRFGPFAASIAVLVTTGLAIWGTLDGAGPFFWSTPTVSLLLLQSFMSVTALATLILAVAVRERNTTQAALQATADDLARSNADLERFAHAASHDLKEPLRSVVSFTQLLSARYKGRLGPDADEFIDYSVKGAARLERLIDDLLAYSRAGATGATPASVPAADALGQALARLEAPIAESGAKVTHDELPVLEADPGQIVQLFQNLVSNAVKFRRSEPPLVHVAARREGAAWIFTVRDNGIGIDPRFASRVFTMFQRLHKRAEYEGSGIGLALCKRIVERHGGRIWLESQPGKGTVVSFSWPAGNGVT